MLQSPDPWTRSEVESELANILRDPEFERNPSVSRFLAYVVSETMEGRGARLKAFTIAVEVFGRDESFDAQSNSIVRVQAARLRQLLEAYYAGPGAADPIRIDMPVGAYRIAITKREAAPECASAPQPPDEAPAAPAKRPRRDPHSGPAAAGLALVVLLAGMVFWLSARTPAQVDWTRGWPTLTVRTGAGSRAEQQPSLTRLSEGLARAIGSFDSLIVTRPALESRVEAPNAYTLVLNAVSSDHASRLSVELLHMRSGAVVWTGEFAAPVDEAGERAVIATAARAIADVHGALNHDMTSRTRPWPARPTGYLCILATLDAIMHRAPDDLHRAFDCLEADIAADADNAHAQGLLSALLVRRYLDAAPGNLGPADLWRATRLARQSFDRDPQRARSAYLLFLTRFYDKRFDEAFVAARRALELNPYATLYAAQIGASYISRGDYAQGETLLAPIATLDRAAPSFLAAYLPLAAFMRDDEAKFQSLARAGSMESGAIGLILRAVGAHRSRDPQAVQRALLLLREEFPGVAADVPAALDRYAFSPEIVAKLMAQWRELAPFEGAH